MSEVKAYLTEGIPSPLNSLREYMHLISAFAHQKPEIPHVLWVPDNTVLQFDGFPIILDDYKKMGLELLSRANKALDVVLCGCKLTAFDDYIDASTNPDEPRNWLQDSPRNTSKGYSFLSDPRNKFSTHTYSLLRQFYDPIFNSSHTFYRVDVGGQILWNPCKFYILTHILMSLMA